MSVAFPFDFPFFFEPGTPNVAVTLTFFEPQVARFSAPALVSFSVAFPPLAPLILAGLKFLPLPLLAVSLVFPSPCRP